MEHVESSDILSFFETSVAYKTWNLMEPNLNLNLNRYGYNFMFVILWQVCLTSQPWLRSPSDWALLPLTLQLFSSPPTYEVPPLSHRPLTGNISALDSITVKHQLSNLHRPSTDQRVCVAGHTDTHFCHGTSTGHTTGRPGFRNV